MIAKLRFYRDSHNINSEYVIICTEEPDQDSLEGMELVDEVTIEGGFTSWPTDRFLIQEYP